MIAKENIQLILVGVCIVAILLYVVYTNQKTIFLEEKEGFVTLDDSDITMNMCPSGTQSVQSKNGDTDCCNGDIVDFKCKGKLVCSLSPAHDGLSSCLEAIRATLRAKGSQICPTSLPRYFENVRAGTAGCTSGSRSADGQSVLDVNQKKCTVYKTDRENRTLVDSCYNQKLLEQYQCPTYPGKSSTKELTQWGAPGGSPPYIACKVQGDLNMTDFCVDDSTAKAFLNDVDPSWRSWFDRSPSNKRVFCSIFQQLRIDKTISEAQLKDIQIP